VTPRTDPWILTVRPQEGGALRAGERDRESLAHQSTGSGSSPKSRFANQFVAFGLSL
jgi:hypothetical protein